MQQQAWRPAPTQIRPLASYKVNKIKVHVLNFRCSWWDAGFTAGLLYPHGISAAERFRSQNWNEVILHAQRSLPSSQKYLVKKKNFPKVRKFITPSSVRRRVVSDRALLGYNLTKLALFKHCRHYISSRFQEFFRLCNYKRRNHYPDPTACSFVLGP